MSSNQKKPALSQKITQLNTAVEWFYSDDFNLDQAAEHYQSTLKLAQEIETDLKNLQNKIEILEKDFSKE